MTMIWALIHTTVGVVAWGLFSNPWGWSFMSAATYTGAGWEAVLVGVGVVFCILAYYYGEALLVNVFDGDHFFGKVVLLSVIYLTFVGIMAVAGFFTIDSYDWLYWWGLIWVCLILGLSKALRQEDA